MKEAKVVAIGKTDQAIICFEKAIALDPGLAIAHFHFAQALMKKGRVGEAVKEFDKALQIRPDFTEAADLRRKLLQSGKTQF